MFDCPPCQLILARLETYAMVRFKTMVGQMFVVVQGPAFSGTVGEDVMGDGWCAGFCSKMHTHLGRLFLGQRIIEIISPLFPPSIFQRVIGPIRLLCTVQFFHLRPRCTVSLSYR